MCWKTPHAPIFPGFEPCWWQGETGVTDSLLGMQRADPVGATPWCSVPAPAHQEMHAEINTKGILVLGEGLSFHCILG